MQSQPYNPYDAKDDALVEYHLKTEPHAREDGGLQMTRQLLRSFKGYRTSSTPNAPVNKAKVKAKRKQQKLARRKGR